MREAISLAVDETILNDRGYQGRLDARKSYIGENSRYFSDAVEAIPTDAARAATLVEEAKADGSDGTIQFEVQARRPAPMSHSPGRGTTRGRRHRRRAVRPSGR